MPCTERFDAQDAAYREDILPDVSNREILRVSIEAGATFGWERYTGLHGLRIGIDRFGVSAPAEDLYEYFGLTPPKIAERGARPYENEGNRMTKVAINGFGRIGRLVARAILERRRSRARAGRDQRPCRRQVQRLAVQARQRPRHIPGRGQRRGRRDDRRRQAHQGHRRARSGQASAQANWASSSRSNAPASSPTAKAGRSISTPAPSGS